MTNTIHNVPRELLAELQEHIHCHHDAVLWGKVCDLLSTPSPAGVDGLEVVATAILGGVEYGIGGPELGEIDVELSMSALCRIQERMVSNEDSVFLDLCSLSGAQAIIDGLSGEVERLQMQLAACGVVALANTIESAGEARQMHPDYMSASCSDVADAVDREIALRTERDQQALRIGELEGLLRAESARVDFLDAHIVTADAPNTGKVAMLADSGTLRECIDAALAELPK